LMQQHGLTGWRVKLDHARRPRRSM
jgi:hypothetical protein